MLSPVMLERLRAWWRLAHAQGKILPGGWLFAGVDPTDLAAATAGLDKRVTPHLGELHGRNAKLRVNSAVAVEQPA